MESEDLTPLCPMCSAALYVDMATGDLTCLRCIKPTGGGTYWSWSVYRDNLREALRAFQPPGRPDVQH